MREEINFSVSGLKWNDRACGDFFAFVAFFAGAFLAIVFFVTGCVVDFLVVAAFAAGFFLVVAGFDVAIIIAPYVIALMASI
jgi:hypothetical protein